MEHIYKSNLKIENLKTEAEKIQEHIMKEKIRHDSVMDKLIEHLAEVQVSIGECRGALDACTPLDEHAINEQIQCEGSTTDEPLMELAKEIAQFMRDIDPYEYSDQVADAEVFLEETFNNLKTGNTECITQRLLEYIEDNSSDEVIKAANLIIRISDEV